MRQQFAHRNLHKIGITVISITIRKGELERFGERVDVVSRIVAQGLQVVARQQIQGFDQRRPLSPEPCFINLITSIIGFDWLTNFGMKPRQICRCQQAAVLPHVIADALANRSFVEIVARSDEARVSTVAGFS